MELFRQAKAARLRSAHNKYLTAEEDEESVFQQRNGSSNAAAWTVEFAEDGFVRLKSCYGKYLTASNHPFLLGMTGRKVLQTLPQRERLDSSLEWEPVVAGGGSVMLRTRYGQFLRGNGGLPPWRNSVTHDVPHRTATKEWVVWEVDVVEILKEEENSVDFPAPEEAKFGEETRTSTSFEVLGDVGSMNSHDSFNCSRQESIVEPQQPNDGRYIYFHIADEDGKVDEGFEELSITFKGNEVNLLKRRLEVELGIDGITVCTKNPLNGKLFPLRLQLPPNNMPMHVVVVPPTSNGDAFVAY